MIRQAKRLKSLMTMAAVTAAALLCAPNALQAQGAPSPFGGGEKIIDFREQMRVLVQNVSGFARRYSPNFVVLADNGLELVGKINPEDDTQVFPARAYIRALDGFLEEKLTGRLNIEPSLDPLKEDPAVKLQRQRLEVDVKTSKMLGLKIFDMEFADTPTDIDKNLQNIAKRGFVPFVGSSEFLGDIPRHPKYVFNANPDSINDVAKAKNFLYVRNSQGFGTVDDYVQTVAATNYDVVITNVFHGRQPLRRVDVERMKYKKLGSRRLVLAEMDISTAATYHYYWQSGWETGNPDFISVPLLEDPDRHRVMYWDPNWLSVISGGTNSYLYGILDLGFDGVVLKGTDAWRFFESGGEQQ